MDQKALQGRNVQLLINQQKAHHSVQFNELFTTQMLKPKWPAQYYTLHPAIYPNKSKTNTSSRFYLLMFLKRWIIITSAPINAKNLGEFTGDWQFWHKLNFRSNEG